MLVIYSMWLDLRKGGTSRKTRFLVILVPSPSYAPGRGRGYGKSYVHIWLVGEFPGTNQITIHGTWQHKNGRNVINFTRSQTFEYSEPQRTWRIDQKHSIIDYTLHASCILLGHAGCARFPRRFLVRAWTQALVPLTPDVGGTSDWVRV